MSIYSGDEDCGDDITSGPGVEDEAIIIGHSRECNAAWKRREAAEEAEDWEALKTASREPRHGQGSAQLQGVPAWGRPVTACTGFALTRQCDECPWRSDVPRRRFSPERFALLSASVEQGFSPMFACHKTQHGEEQACVGYLLSPESTQNFNVRIALIRDAFDPAKLKPSGPQFATYRAMARANGVRIPKGR